MLSDTKVHFEEKSWVITSMIFFALLRQTQQIIDTLLSMGYLFVNNIRTIREKAGFTQQQLADLVSVDRSQICRYENGEQQPSADMLNKLATNLRVSMEALIREKYEYNSEGEPVVNFSNGQVVRAQLFSQSDTYSLTIYPDGIRFSTGCIRKWIDITYISIITLDDKKLLVVRMSDEDEYDSLRWSCMRKDKKYGRKITGRPFSNEIYGMMDWSRGYYYRTEGKIGINQLDENEKIWVFDLERSEKYPMSENARIKAGVRNEDLERDDIEILGRIEKEKEEEKSYRQNMRKEGKEPGPLKRYVFYPDKWGQYTFGLPVMEHGKVPEVELDPKT